MVETDDFNNLLKTGSWRTSRSRSPGHDRLTQSSRTYGSDESNAWYSRPTGLPRRPKGPPAPSVEDEVDSLAREHTPSLAPSSSDDEPVHRGEIDQQPILLPVAENNEERRFVIVTNPDVGAEDSRDTPTRVDTQSPENTEYDENTCRQYVLVTSEDDPTKTETRLPRKKSHQDLPRLNTAVADEEPPPIRRSSSRRNREKVVVDQPARGSGRSPEETFSSPVVTQTAGGRERAYLDLSSGVVRPSGMRGPREEPKKSRDESRRSGHTSSSPSVRRRLSSTAGARPPRDALGAFGYGNPEDVLAFMNPASELPPRSGRRMSESPTKSRKSSSPPYPSSSRDRLPDRGPGHRRRRESNAREQGDYYGSDAVKSSRSDRSARSRYPEADPDALLFPEIPTRTGLKGPSPLPSPRVAQGSQFSDAPSLSSPKSPRSTTLPYPLDSRRAADEYSVSSSTTARDESTKGSRPPAPSRSSSIPNGISMPIPFGSNRTNTSERRTPATVQEETQVSDSPTRYWQPPPFDPEQHRSYLEGPIVSYRRYSEDVEHGLLPRLPECRWATPRANTGGMSFLTLPRADNFVICRECYDNVFADKTEFSQAFVQAPVRPEQQISCSFGSSFWYRVAFLMVLKYRHPDLRLLENVATVARRHAPCSGDKRVSRIWFSIMVPSSRRPLRDLKICSYCIGMIGVLFTNLGEAFLPVEPYGVTSSGRCELRFEVGRNRFTKYFDLLETTSDEARTRRIVPDLQQLADDIRNIFFVDECLRSRVLRNEKWHVMDSLPEFTVCEECYDDVVWPLVEKSKSDVPGHFIRGKQTLPAASCQLYSTRMRDVFQLACRDNDMGYLEKKLKEKLASEADLREKKTALLERDQNDPKVQREMAEIERILKEIE